MSRMKEKLEEWLEHGGIDTDYEGFMDWLDENHFAPTDEQLEKMAQIEKRLRKDKTGVTEF